MHPFRATALSKIDHCLMSYTGLRLIHAKVKGANEEQELMLLCGELMEASAFLQGYDEQRLNVVIEYLEKISA